MPWNTPTLRDVRSLVRDSIHGSLPGSDATIPNSVLRVMSDTQGALCFLTLEYVDWLSLKLLPDTSETEWLDRHGNIWLVNADGTTGRKQATMATGVVTATGLGGSIVPAGAMLGSGQNATYQVTAQVVIGSGPTLVPVTALDAGTIGNLNSEDVLSFLVAPPGVDNTVTVITMDGGTDTETDGELRSRILRRIQQPPMGGDKTDYEQWALAVPGVTRAWASPQEMGIGTMTVRFLMDDLRSYNDGWPQTSDILAVTDYIDKMRPVTVKDCYVEAPIKQFMTITIANLVPDTVDTRAEIELSVQNMLKIKAAPAQTIYASWVNYAIMNAPSVISFKLVSDTDYVMFSLGHMAVLNTILYNQAISP
jgi:uncharacterized phage protein gp47/JayE